MDLQRTLDKIDRRMMRIEQMLEAQQDEWLTQAQVKEKYGYSAKSLQTMRTDGRINHKDFRSSNGRKFQYKKDAIDKLFN